MAQAPVKPTGEISIALCTHNGEQFLMEQLTSLLEQSSLPKEIRVFDDDSTDRTRSILDTASAGSTVPIHVHQNRRRQGILANFQNAIQSCSGEYTALCDQDDLWSSEKLEVFERSFSRGAYWVACDAHLVDAKMQPLGYTLWQRMQFNEKERGAAEDGNLFEVLLKHYVVAGATLAFRSDLRSFLLPIPSSWHYDAWLIAMLSALWPGTMIRRPLQYYRQHSANAIGGTRNSIFAEARAAMTIDRRKYYDEEIKRWSALAERLAQVDAPLEARNKLSAKIAHLERRAALPRARLKRAQPILAEHLKGCYARYSRNWGSIVMDLIAR